MRSVFLSCDVNFHVVYLELFLVADRLNQFYVRSIVFSSLS